MASSAYVKPRDEGPQAAGSVVTYLRRYMLAAAACIAQDDDDGNFGQGKGKPKKEAAPPPAKQEAPLPPGLTPALPGSVQALAIAMAAMGIKERDARLEWMCGHLGRRVTSSKETSEAEIQMLIVKAKNGEAPPAARQPGEEG
jgi:hypothetical protein